MTIEVRLAEVQMGAHTNLGESVIGADTHIEMRRGELQVKMNELANMVAVPGSPPIERAARAALVREWARGGDIRLSPCLYASNVWSSKAPSSALGMYLPIHGDTVEVYRGGRFGPTSEPPKWSEPADVFPSEWMVANIALMIHALGHVLP